MRVEIVGGTSTDAPSSAEWSAQLRFDNSSAAIELLTGLRSDSSVSMEFIGHTIRVYQANTIVAAYFGVSTIKAHSGVTIVDALTSETTVI